MVDPIWILLAFACCGLLLTLVLWVAGAIRPDPCGSKFRAFDRRPGEDTSAQSLRGIKILFYTALTLIGVWAFIDAVTGGVFGPHALVRTPFLRIVYGASGFLLAAIAVTLSGRLSSTRWPRE